jgi:hypothetical protein
MKWKCSNCNSENVQVKMWVMVNESNEPNESVSDSDLEDNWCNDCETHSNLKYI